LAEPGPIVGGPGATRWSRSALRKANLAQQESGHSSTSFIRARGVARNRIPGMCAPSAGADMQFIASTAVAAFVRASVCDSAEPLRVAPTLSRAGYPRRVGRRGRRICCPLTLGGSPAEAVCLVNFTNRHSRCTTTTSPNDCGTTV